ncbi:hypothetical protein Bbelb_407420 [Branchiostoma belcheri]|nr:hypothetical protein Bbelb_407420 [Branchiostoma belcheri]
MVNCRITGCISLVTTTTNWQVSVRSSYHQKGEGHGVGSKILVYRGSMRIYELYCPGIELYWFTGVFVGHTQDADSRVSLVPCLTIYSRRLVRSCFFLQQETSPQVNKRAVLIAFIFGLRMLISVEGTTVHMGLETDPSSVNAAVVATIAYRPDSSEQQFNYSSKPSQGHPEGDIGSGEGGFLAHWKHRAGGEVVWRRSTLPSPMPQASVRASPANINTSSKHHGVCEGGERPEGNTPGAGRDGPVNATVNAGEILGS